MKRGTLQTGWHYADEQILRSQGTRSTRVVGQWVDHVFPTLEGLVERLEAPSASFLDVGVGVAALAIEISRRFPGLRTLGMDPLETALVVARGNVEAAGLGDRISLRALRVDDLDDQSAFDLAHVPIQFLDTDGLSQGLRRVRAALRPGGWLVLQMLGTSGAGLMPSVLRLLSVLWGSEALPPERAEAMVAGEGYEEVSSFPPLPGSPVGYVVGRRPPRPPRRQGGSRRRG